LAYAMIDDNVAYVSPSTVYRILREENLVCRWKPNKNRAKRVRFKGRKPDQKWQSDIRYVKLGRSNYYLITFIDEYSRFIVHHELLRSMDGDSVAWAAAKALSPLPPGVKPVIQTDNGSGYVSLEFKLALSDKGVGHHRIRPHCPEENGIVERSNRTLGDKIDELELSDYQQAKDEISDIIEWYNHDRLHSGIDFLPPWEMYRGDPSRRLAERRIKVEEARFRRREANLGISQRALCLEVKGLEEILLNNYNIGAPRSLCQGQGKAQAPLDQAAVPPSFFGSSKGFQRKGYSINKIALTSQNRN